MRRTVTRPSRLRGAVRPPGDKSISHRALIFNALAHGTATVSGLGRGDDVFSTIRCLRSLGVSIEEGKDPRVVTIEGRAGALHEPIDVLDAGNSGTSMRLLTGVLAGQSMFSIISGDSSLRFRPMGRVVQPLTLMGAHIQGRQGNTLAPLAISGGQLRGIEYDMPVASAQVKSSLMLAGLSASSQTVLHQPALSRDHTERMFRAMGAKVVEDGLTLVVHPGQLKALDVEVPADISGAAFWIVAALCHPDADVTIQGVGVNPSRTGILDVLMSMGGRITLENQRTQGGEPVADLRVVSSELHGVDIGGDLIPSLIDEVPVLAVAACFARGTTTIRDAQELRVKESDRIRTTTNQLASLGAHIEELPDGMTIQEVGSLSGGGCQSYGDHRLAMALAIAGLVGDGPTTIEGAEAASVSYPGFWDHLAYLAG